MTCGDKGPATVHAKTRDMSLDNQLWATERWTYCSCRVSRLISRGVGTSLVDCHFGDRATVFGICQEGLSSL
jgi:hypothetical protein